MKPIAKNSSFIFIFFLLLYTCAKEGEETSFESEQEIIKIEKLDAKKASADWQKFNTTANNLLAITTTNLKSLLTKSRKAKNKTEKEAYIDNYNQSRNKFKELKNRLEKENIIFKSELHKYSQQTEIKNQTFKNLFLHDILELNNNLENILDEINTD